MAGLTINGFESKTLQEIKAELEADYRAAFGEDIDVSSTSVIGQVIGNQAKKYAQLWELLQALYSSFDPDNAEGVPLDGVAGFVATRRLPAAPSTAIVALYGDVGTELLSADFLIRQTETEREFSLDEDITIEKTNTISMTLSVDTVSDSTDYEVTISSTAYTYTSDASATEAEIIAGLVSEINGVSSLMSAEDNGDGTLTIVSLDGKTGYSVLYSANLALEEIASPGEFTAVTPGALSVPIGTLTEVVTPVSGLDSIDNLVSGTVGTDVETDAQLRERRRKSLTGLGRGTSEAIRSRLLQEVSGTYGVSVLNNRTDSTDGDGRPPHSFEVVLQGGDEDEIAEKIWENMPVGIQTFGGTTITVQDSEGDDQDISFSRPTSIYIWLDIELSLYPEEDFPTGGISAVKDAVVEWSLTEYTAGKDVIRQRVSIPVYSVPGIGEITITIGTSSAPATPPGSYTATDVSIATNELAIFDQTRIGVTII